MMPCLWVKHKVLYEYWKTILILSSSLTSNSKVLWKTQKTESKGVTGKCMYLQKRKHHFRLLGRLKFNR